MRDLEKAIAGAPSISVEKTIGLGSQVVGLSALSLVRPVGGKPLTPGSYGPG